MPSKRERDYARRRYAKQVERLNKAARLRRERRIVIIITILAFVLVGGSVIYLNRSAEQAAQEASSSAALEALGSTPPSATATVAPLPTTVPQQWQAPPPASDSLDADWNVVMHTSVGDVTMVLDGALAPQAVSNFIFLAQNGFYDGTACHRLLPGSLLQCGDPTATGTGGPGYSFGPIENAPADGNYVAGTLAMARQGGDGNSMGSQFFLVFADVQLPNDAAGGYSVFGQITGGLDILQQIGGAGTLDGSGDGRPAIDVIITGVEVSQ